MSTFMAGIRASATHHTRDIQGSQWLRAAIVCGVLAACVLFPWVLSMRLQLLLAGCIVLAGSVVLFVRWPSFGIVTLLVCALMVPSPRLPGGLNVAVLLLVLLLGLWLLETILSRSPRQFIMTGPVKPLLALVVVTLIAFLLGQLAWFDGARHAPLDSQLGGVAIFVLAPGAFYLVAYRIKDLRWLQRMTWVYLAICAIYLVGWFVPLLGPITGRLLQVGTIDNSLFWVWMVAMAFSQVLINKQLPLPGRVALWILTVAAVITAFVFLYDWKSGWMPSLVAIAAILGVRYGLRHWWLLFLLGPPAVLLAMQLGEGAIASDEYSYSTRLDAWKLVLEMSRSNLLTGFGPANYRFYTPLFPIRGFRIYFNSHNQFVDIIAQVGLLGLACVFWFFAEMGRLAWRLRTQVPAGFAQAYVYGVIGGLAGTMVACMLVDWLLPFVYNIGLVGFRGSLMAWLFMGGLVSIDLMSRQSVPTSTQAGLPGMGGKHE